MMPGSMTPLTVSTFFMCIDFANQVSQLSLCCFFNKLCLTHLLNFFILYGLNKLQ